MTQKKRKQQTFEYGALILICSTVLVKVIGAVFKIPLSNLIGDVGFGYFSSAYDLFTPIYSLAMAGLPIAVSRVVAEHMAKERYNDVRQSLSITRKLFFFTGFAGLIVMLALIYPFVMLTDKTGNTIYSLFAIAPSLLFCCVMSTYRGYYEGLRNMYPTAVSDVTEALGKLVLGFGFAYVTMKLTNNNVALAAAAAMLGVTVGAGAAALYLWLRFKIKGDAITKEEFSKAPAAMDKKLATKALIAIAIPVVLSSLANNIASLVDVSLVKRQLITLVSENGEYLRKIYATSIADYVERFGPLTSAEIPTFLYGIRSKAFTIYNLVPTITSVLGVSALPVIASFWTRKDKRLIKRNIESTIKLTALIAMPAGIGFFAIGKNIMALMYSTVASYEIGGKMMQIYGFAAIFAGLAIPMTSMLQAIDKQVLSLRNVAIGAATKVIVNYICVGIKTINIQGAAVGTFACYFVISVLNLISLCKHTGIIPNFYKTMLKPLISASACGAAAFFVMRGNISAKATVVKIIAAAVVYLLFLIILNVFEEDDVLSLPGGERLLPFLKKFKFIR